MEESPIPREFSRLLAKFGASHKSVLKIHFGGVVGKLALVAFATVVGLAAVGLRANNPYLWGACIVAILIMGLSGMVAIAHHGHKHPVEATLEGGEVVLLKHIEQEFATKELREIPTSQQIPEGIGKKSLQPAKEETS